MKALLPSVEVFSSHSRRSSIYKCCLHHALPKKTCFTLHLQPKKFRLYHQQIIFKQEALKIMLSPVRSQDRALPTFANRQFKVTKNPQFRM